MLQVIYWHGTSQHGRWHDALQIISWWQGLIMHGIMASIITTWHYEENRFSDLVKIRVDMSSSFLTD